MSLRCTKCHQSPPHQGDSWCLSCSAHEALGAELQQAWGYPASRQIACDILVSGLRQIRALRRFGLAGRGGGAESRASATEGAGLDRASRARSNLPGPKPAPSVPRGPPQVKKEESEEEGSESEASESGEEEKDEAPAAAAKVKPDHESSRTRLRSVAAGSRSEAPRDSEKVEKRDRSLHPKSRGAERSRSRRGHKEREEKHRSRREDKERDKKDRSARKEKRQRYGHRGGSKHQKFGKAAEDPYRRFHYRAPDHVWDEARDNF